jgi:nucleobase:cation symporter-1, NCS1 family
MIAYFLYFLIQLPFLLIHYKDIRWFFLFKSIVSPIAFFAVMGVIVHQAGGNISGSSVIDSGSLRGSTLVWYYFSNMNSVMGTYATLAGLSLLAPRIFIICADMGRL